MSMTTTEQVTEVKTDPLLIRLYDKKTIVKNKLNDLILHLNESGLFTSDELSKLATWETEFYQDHFTDLSNPEVQDNVSWLLCDLLQNIIMAVYDRFSDNRLKQDELFGFEDDLKEILKLTLPAGKEVDEYIFDYEDYMATYKIYILKKIAMKASFQAEKEELYKIAQNTDAALIQNCNAVCGKLGKIVTEIKDAGNEGFDEINRLSKEADHLFNNLNNLEKSVGDLTKKHEAQEVIFQNNLKKYEITIIKGTQS